MFYDLSQPNFRNPPGNGQKKRSRLRHSCAAMLGHEGVPIQDIQKWLGHLAIVTTEGIYAHFDENGNIGSANKLAGAFGVKDVEEPKPSSGEMK
jgi:hypothetical protein